MHRLFPRKFKVRAMLIESVIFVFEIHQSVRVVNPAFIRFKMVHRLLQVYIVVVHNFHTVPFENLYWLYYNSEAKSIYFTVFVRMKNRYLPQKQFLEIICVIILIINNKNKLSIFWLTLVNRSDIISLNQRNSAFSDEVELALKSIKYGRKDFWGEMLKKIGDYCAFDLYGFVLCFLQGQGC